MFLGSRARPVRRADDLTAICKPVFWTTLQTPTAGYGMALLHTVHMDTGSNGREARQLSGPSRNFG
jgi:hypothetical protein